MLRNNRKNENGLGMCIDTEHQAYISQGKGRLINKDHCVQKNRLK